MEPSERHLDIGCGKFPRNPYGRAHLSGIDVRPPPTAVEFEHRVANLVVEPIPFPDDSFGSVSAYDFLEHVPRLWPDGNGGTVFPFIRLMDEIWRVLAPQGRLWALTPGYPNAEAFTDPTHVNFITERTHEYFCGDNPLGRMYGFGGRFRAVRMEWVHVHDAYSALQGSPENRAPRSPGKKLARGIRRMSRWLRGRPEDHRKIYLLWELEAVKPSA